MINPLVPEFSAQCTLQNTGNLNDHTLGPGYTRDWLPAYSFVSRARARRDTTRQDCFVVIPAHTGVTIVYCGTVVPAIKCQLDDSVSQVKRVFFGYGRRKSEDGIGYILFTAADC